MPELDRITHDPDVMAGRACIRGMRVTVSLVLNLLASGMSNDEIIKSYPYLQSDDIRQTLQYAVHLADESDHRDKQNDAWVTDNLNRIYSEEDSSLDPAIAALQWASLRKVEW